MTHSCPPWHGRHERGSGTVLAVGLIGVLLTCLVGGLAVASAVHASQRARAAADLAALAGAAAFQRGLSEGTACHAALRLAAANGAVLRECRVADDLSVTVQVAVPVGHRLPGTLGGPARAEARAGPAP